MGQIEARQLSRFWKKAVPSGTVNGSNAVFTLPSEPLESDAVQVFLNGIYKEPTSEVSVSGTTITFVTAPAVGQTVSALYIEKSGGS
jgi:hypothetical protein